MITVARKTTITLGLMAIAVSSVWPAQAQMMTEENLNPLPQSEGSAADLAGILPKDSALWLGGVGGEGDIDAEGDYSPYEIRSDQFEGQLTEMEEQQLLESSQLRLGVGRF
ncbi:slr0587 [Synechocystis sp. PCC 6803]|uniref:Slr0587 protein n=1 Tax=Synechocystis sp. (strain ATCC 27184 / PCC 6803 / Kazusa) TaxID=1111708 RepID=P74723_SYNY3|nr:MULTISPECIES: hypothetical protein [unclassified Synechocystis]BAM53281.1 hypothetical protein BEST7613_4350 [Synechocystis sp. PCC 6803] [Bacillus subtilis BEST7613]AGF53392.1 hypothetical protein MYO_131730 [Synechocystis sp. PCC 6803]ALJ69260.1 hypothetical protein AOY38_16315 [Synechocystis sp. PCC 6803]AVP91125.1 hypothetical protein C7I86_16470 [Synechocystis sp. IPPAS B-1465]MBD2619435.1 hypothetical protein [Synechocystis sp. FACHB-898]